MLRINIKVRIVDHGASAAFTASFKFHIENVLARHSINLALTRDK